MSTASYSRRAANWIAMLLSPRLQWLMLKLRRWQQHLTVSEKLG
jgi:hypothetical protein